MNDNIIIGPDGKPQFFGKEVPNQVHFRKEASSQMQCPQCKTMVDYLLGNVRQGCESCYDRTKDEPEKGNPDYDKSRELL